MVTRNISQIRGNGRLPQLRSKQQVIALAMPHTRLVTFLAKRYLGQGLKLDDLISAGYDGLLRAGELYNPNKGRFSSYASIQIKAAIQQAIKSKGREIKNPSNAVKAMRRINLTEAYLTQKYRRPVTNKEIAEFLEITEEKAVFLRQKALRPRSLDEPLNGDGRVYADIIRDESSPDPEVLTSQAEMARRITEALSFLSAREVRALKMVFGLGKGGEKSYSEVAAIFAEIEGNEALSRERIRQIVDGALEKLREKYLELREYLDHNGIQRFDRNARSFYLRHEENWSHTDLL